MSKDKIEIDKTELSTQFVLLCQVYTSLNEVHITQWVSTFFNRIYGQSLIISLETFCTIHNEAISTRKTIVTFLAGYDNTFIVKIEQSI